MTKQEFISGLQDVLEIETELTEDSDLTRFEEYSSLSILSIILYIDEKFGKRFPEAKLAAAPKVGDLIALIGEDSFN